MIHEARFVMPQQPCSLGPASHGGASYESTGCSRDGFGSEVEAIGTRRC